jgi:glycosyltransferase involved in cell wall biosynthesis
MSAPGAERLRVALLSPCFWPEVRRGGERFARDLATGLLENGHCPTLITSHRGRPARTVEDRLPILRLPRPPHGPLLRRMYEPYVTHVPLSYAALRTGAYDVAHAVYATDALAAGRWHRRTGRPAVLTYLGLPERAWLMQRRRGRVLGCAIRSCDAVVALSSRAAQEFERVLGYQAPVIPPGVDLNAFAPTARRAEVPTIICSAAAEEPRKHVGLLVEAFARVRRELPNARLILSRPRDLNATRRAGVPIDAPGVYWTDLDDRAALADAYATAWLAVLPSSSEAFGLVLVEALACGTPIVGYDDGGVAEIIDRPEIGRLFGRLDAGTLARALLEAIELTDDPDTATQCRSRAEAFSLQRCTGSYLQLYREFGAGRG